MRFAYIVTGNRHDAEDAVQDALVGIYPRWRRVSSHGDPDAYIRRSIVNANITRWRRTRKTTPYPDLDPATRTDGDATDAFADAALLAELLRGLQPRQRAIVALRYLEDRSYADIATLCNCTDAAARSVVRHALNALRDAVDKEQP